MAATASKRSTTTKPPQEKGNDGYLPDKDSDGGTMAPPKIEKLDSLGKDLANAKKRRAKADKDVQDLTAALLEALQDHRDETGGHYDVEVGGEIYRSGIDEEARLSFRRLTKKDMEVEE